MNLPAKNKACTTTDPRWLAIVKHDLQADGKFYYSVKTTKVYCCPSCGARLPNPENIQFHDTYLDAEEAGFRPCKRCKPDQLSFAKQQVEKITAVCRLIEMTEKTPDLKALAGYVSLSPYHFHRIFKATMGLTPKQYATACRMQRVYDKLSQNQTITDTIFAAGYMSNGRFYKTSNALLGMTLSNYRSGGMNSEIYFAIGRCFLGFILVAKSKLGICAIFLGDDPEILLREVQNKFPFANLVGGDKNFEQLIAKIIEFIEMPSLAFDLPLDIQGTAFQQRVWQVLKDIPLGATVSYMNIAKKIGNPKAIRAVARACAANMLAVVIPCHRVVRNDGSLSGYRWGIERKRILLEYEKSK